LLLTEQTLIHMHIQWCGITASPWAPNSQGYRGGNPTAVQAWRPCPLWEPSPSHPILL